MMDKFGAYRHVFPTLAVGVVLGLTAACAGSGQPRSVGTFHPEGDTSPAASSSPSHSPKRSQPKLASRLPDDVHVIFETSLPKKHRKAAVIKAYRNFEIASQLIILSRGKKRPDKRYITPSIEPMQRKLIHAYKSRHRTVTGTLRFYRTHVTSMKKHAAFIKTCVGQKHAYDRDLRTGKVIKNSPGPPQHWYSVRAGLRLEKGQWRVNLYDAKIPDKECKR